MLFELAFALEVVVEASLRCACVATSVLVQESVRPVFAVLRCVLIFAPAQVLF